MKNTSNELSLSLVWASIWSVIYACLLMLLRGPSEWLQVWAGDFDDPDTFYLLNLIWNHRQGVPFGLTPRMVDAGGAWIHWSHVFPTLVDMLARIFAFVGISADHSLYLSVSLWGVLPWCALLALLPWVVPGDRIPLRTFLAYLLLCAPAVVWQLYGSPIRGTHHMLMDVLMLGAMVAYLREWDIRWVAGLAVSSLWVSPELFPFLLLILLLGALGGRTKDALGIALYSAVSIVVISLFDPPYVRYGIWAPDHISLAYGVLFLMVAGVLSAMLWYPSISWWMRGGFLGVISIVWLLIIPGLRLGIHGIVPDDLYNLWYVHVGELHETYSWPFVLVYTVGNAITLFFGSVYLSRSRRSDDWLLMLAAWIYIAMALLHVRTVMPSMILSTMVFLRGFSMTGWGARAACWFLGLVGLLLQFVCFDATSHQHLSESERTNCFVDEAAPEMMQIIPANDGLIAEMDVVPQILWWTRGAHFRVSAGPYHRDHEGMRLYYGVSHDSLDMHFVRSRALMHRYRMHYVAFCPYVLMGDMRKYQPDNGLFMQLIAGYHPSWVQNFDVGGKMLMFHLDDGHLD